MDSLIAKKELFFLLMSTEEIARVLSNWMVSWSILMRIYIFCSLVEKDRFSLVSVEILLLIDL